MSSTIMRAGDADRDAIAAHIREAHAKGHLDVLEMTERIDIAMSAITVHDLAHLADDIPPMLILTGKAGTPGRLRGLRKKPWLYVTGVFAGLMTAIPLPFFLGFSHLPRSVKYSLVTVSIITGLTIFVTSFITSDNEFDWF